MIKISVVRNDTEVTIECANSMELRAIDDSVVSKLVAILSPLSSKSQLGGEQSVSDSDLFSARADEIASLLAQVQPQTATWIADTFKEEPLFRVPSGDPVHVIRRILGQDDRFAKTLSGRFTLAERLASTPAPPANSQATQEIDPFADLDDPFADE